MLLLLLACAEYKTPLSMDPLWVGTTAPDRGHVVAEITDSSGRTVDDWTVDELELLVDGEAVDATFGAWSDDDIAERTIVLLDLSDGADIGALKAAARTAIEQTDGRIALAGYATEVTVFHNLTDDKEALRAALDELEILGSATDTNQALLDVLDLWEDTLDPTTGGVRGAVLYITDGGDGPEAVGDGEVVDYAAGRPIIGVGIGTTALATHGQVRVGSAEDLPDAMTEALDLLQASRQGLIHVSWCGGGEQAELTFKRGRMRASLLENTGGGGASSTAMWGQVTDLPEPVQNHSARIIGDVLVIGGGDWEGGIFTARILDGGLLGHFREGPPIPDPGSETRFGSWDGRVVAINGDKAWTHEIGSDQWEDLESPLYANVIREHEGTLFSVSRQHLYRYDGDGWTQSGPVPDNGLDGYVGATISDGRLVLVGGYRADATQPWQTRAFSVSLTGAMDDWTELPPLPHYMGSFVVADGDGSQVLVFPGSDAESQDVMRLDGGGWTAAGSLSVPRDYFSTAIGSDGRVYLHGGKVEGDKTQSGNVSALDGNGDLVLTCL